MPITHNAIIDRVIELGFNKDSTFTIMIKMTAGGMIWIVNDKTDIFGFAPRNITVKELVDANLWPK
jgi:hypothetical protein